MQMNLIDDEGWLERTWPPERPGFVWRRKRVAGEHLGGILVDEIIAALDRVEHVPLPVVFFDVAQRRADAALGSSRVGARGIELTDNRDIGFTGHLDGRHQTGASGADNDRVVSVIGHVRSSVR